MWLVSLYKAFLPTDHQWQQILLTSLALQCNVVDVKLYCYACEYAVAAVAILLFNFKYFLISSCHSLLLLLLQPLAWQQQLLQWWHHWSCCITIIIILLSFFRMPISLLLLLLLLLLFGNSFFQASNASYKLCCDYASPLQLKALLLLPASESSTR